MSSPSPRPWYLAWLDAFLPEPLRRTSPSELRRYRVLVGMISLLALSCVLWSAYVLVSPNPETPVLLPLVSLAGYVTALIAVRRWAAPNLAALILCLDLAAGVLLPGFLRADPYSSTHVGVALIPLLAVYLMRTRLGVLVALSVALTSGLVHPLYYTAVSGSPHGYSESYFWSTHIFAGICLMLAWAVGALNSSSRDEAQAALEQTLKTLHDSESKLMSLFENTDDMACSLDTEGRLVIANSAWKRRFSERFGVVPPQGQLLLPGNDSPLYSLWRQRQLQVIGGQRLKFEEEYELNGARVVLESSMGPIRGADGKVVGMTVFTRDITPRKEAESRLGEMHRTLVDVSRQAGMAEIATGVLHNVGNTLNSVNISTSLVIDRLRQSRVTGLAKVAQLLRTRAPDFDTFFLQDPQGRKLPGYIMALSDELQEERDAVLQEMNSLSESVDHIKSIVTMQQKHARTAGTIEELSVPQLIDEALRLHAVSFERLGITIERDYAQVPPVLVDRHKLLQILINLLSNARHALVDSNTQDKRLIIRIRRSEDERRLLIDVQDNGGGVAPENMPRLFTQGFTTKKTGHGFGLHISALAASEMKGRLSCTSPGPGQGATFTLELPMADEEASS